MAETGLAALQQVPEGVRSAAELIAGLDQCLVVGLGRLGAEEQEHLRRLAATFAGTALDAPLAEALAGVERREVLPRLGLVLAAARAALQGAQHDALAEQAATALGRTVAAEAAPAPPARAVDAAAVWAESTQHWLMELAQTGFQHLDQETVAPFAATLTQVQDEPALSRWAALLTGFHQELLHALPVSALPSIPRFRWADLWTRSMLRSLAPAAVPPPGTACKGTLAPLGVELRQHGSFASFVFHSVLDAQDAPARIVRTTLASYKVDALRGEELWRCLDRSAQPLLQALSGQTRLHVEEMTLLAAGDLLWDGKARKGPAFPRFSWAAEHLTPGAAEAPALTRLAAEDRHPLHLAVPVFLEGVKVAAANGCCTLTTDDGATVPVTTVGLGSASALQPEHLSRARRLLGLLRFDGGAWQVQPLGVEMAKGQTACVGDNAYEAATKKRKQDTLAILRERASRLLRKKA